MSRTGLRSDAIDHLTQGSSRRLILLLIAAALLRAVIALVWGGYPPVIHDAKDYDQLAATLVETGSYATPGGQPSSLRPPLYPAIVASLYATFGLHNYIAITIAQSLLSLLTVVLAYRLGSWLYDAKVGLWAAAVIAFYPSLLAFNCFVLSEVFFTFLLLTAVLASVSLLRDGDWRTAVLLGLTLSLGSLTRSVLWLCVAPVLACIVLLGEYGLGRRVALAGLAFAVFAAVLTPWAWRNTKVQRTFTLIDVMGGRNVMMGNYEYTPLERSWATISDVTGEKSWHRVLQKETPSYSQLTQGEIDKQAMAYGISYFFAHPLQSAKRCAVRFFNFWQLERTVVAGLRQGEFGPTSTSVTLAAAGIFCGAYAAVALLAICGAIVTPPPWRFHILMLVWILVPCAVHTIAFAHSRYHLPLIPLVAVYAAAGGLRLWQTPQLYRSWRGLVAGLAAAVLVAAWVRELVMVDLKWFQ